MASIESTPTTVVLTPAAPPPNPNNKPIAIETPVTTSLMHHKPPVLTTPVTTSTSKSKRKRESLIGIQPVKLAPNPFNMTARNFPKRRHMTKSTNGFLARKNKMRNASPSEALDQVRAALQPSLNVEIEKVLVSYQEMFRMAAYNVGDNLKETLTEDHISSVLRNCLEEAKKLFKLENDVENQDEKQDELAWTPARNVIITKKKMQLRQKDVKAELKVKDDFDYPSWDEGRLTESVEMIMGVKANKILGFATSARGRLYTRHPQLFKYITDQEDKTWLFQNGHLAVTTGKSFVMLAEDIRLLAINHPEYKDNLGIKGEDVKGFIVPEFLLKKVKLCMKKQALIQKVRKSTDSP